MHCVCCQRPITRGELLAWAGRCDECAARPDDLTPAERAYAAHLLRLALAHARGETPLVADSQGRHYLYEAIA